MKTKLIFILFIFFFTGLTAQQNEKKRLQKADESGFIEVDKAPELISQLKLVYPQLAKLSSIQGTVFLKLLIDKKGKVEKAKIEQVVKEIIDNTAKEIIDNAALEAVQDAKFSPALVDNKPVKVWVVLPIVFKLDPNQELFSSKQGEDPGINDSIAVEKLPEMIEVETPIYPEEAKKNGVGGKVYVKVLVDKEGNAKKAIIIKSENEIFNQPSIDAAMKSKFTPALQNNLPIAVWIVLPYKFKPDEVKKK